MPTATPGLKTVWQSALTDTHTTDVEGVGQLRYESDGKVYRYVKNAEASTALAQGQICCHTVADGEDLHEQVKIPLTANLNNLAGVVMATSLAAGSYGWIQVLGPNSTVAIFQSQTTAWVPGTVLKGVNAVTYADFDVTLGTAPTRPTYIMALETVATVTTGASANKKALIRCLG